MKTRTSIFSPWTKDSNFNSKTPFIFAFRIEGQEDILPQGYKTFEILKNKIMGN